MVCSLTLVALLNGIAPASDPRQVVISTPLVIVELDTGKMKGDLTRLSWSADGSEFYAQTAERDRSGNIKAVRHFIVSVTPKSMKEVESEPPWAAKYWSWKSAQSSPAAPAFKIVVDGPHRENRRSTAAPTGGVLAKGGTADPASGTTAADVAAAVDQTQIQVVYALKLKNETLGEWINEPVTPGVNFGWAPAPFQLIAFTKRDGGPIVVLDDSGRKQELAGAKSAFFPAWSDDGKRIAWLERKDRKKYVLTVAEISTP